MRKISASILSIFTTIVVCLKRPWHLFACYIASRQPEQDSNYCYDDGRYEVVSVDTSASSSLNILLNTDRIKHRRCFETIITRDDLIYPSKIIQCEPWTVNIVDDNLLRGMWEFRPKLAHFVTVNELWKGLELGIVSIETAIQDGEIKYFVVVNSGNDDKWKFHQLQQEWKRYQTKRREKHLDKLKRREVFAR